MIVHCHVEFHDRKFHDRNMLLTLGLSRQAHHVDSEKELEVDLIPISTPFDILAAFIATISGWWHQIHWLSYPRSVDLLHIHPTVDWQIVKPRSPCWQCSDPGWYLSMTSMTLKPIIQDNHDDSVWSTNQLCNPTGQWSLLVNNLIPFTQWPFQGQDPIDWRYLPYIRPM